MSLEIRVTKRLSSRCSRVVPPTCVRMPPIYQNVALNIASAGRSRAKHPNWFQHISTPQPTLLHNCIYDVYAYTERLNDEKSLTS